MREIGRLFTWILGAFVIIAIILDFTIVERVAISHNGMAPTIFATETVLAWEGATGEIGDIMLCRAQVEGATSFVVGRVAGRGGDEVTWDGGILHINGRRAALRYPSEEMFFDSDVGYEVGVKVATETFPNEEYLVFENLQPSRNRAQGGRVAPGHLYLVGDNRVSRGHDSRQLGTIREADCVGQIFLRLDAEHPPGTESIEHRPFELLLF